MKKVKIQKIKFEKLKPKRSLKYTKEGNFKFQKKKYM